MKKILLVIIVAVFSLSLGLYGQTDDTQTDQNLQKTEHNKHRYEKGNSTSGEKIRNEQSNQGESSKIKHQERNKNKNVRREAKGEAKRTMKAERSGSKAGR